MRKTKFSFSWKQCVCIVLLMCASAVAFAKPVDKSSNNSVIQDKKLTYTKISDYEWQISGIPSTCYISMIGINSVKDNVQVLLNDQVVKLRMDSSYTYLESEIFDTVVIESLVIKSDYAISFDEIYVKNLLGCITVGFKNFNLNKEFMGISEDEARLLRRCGVEINNRSLEVNFYAMCQLLNDNPTNFYGTKVLGEKSELQLKKFWESEEGAAYLNLFNRVKEIALKEELSEPINFFDIGDYDLKNGCFTVNAGDSVFDSGSSVIPDGPSIYRMYIVNGLKKSEESCEEVFTNGVRLRYKKYSFVFKVNEDDALKIEENKKDARFYLKYKVKGHNSYTYTVADVWKGTNVPYTLKSVEIYDAYIVMVKNETEVYRFKL